MTPETWRRITDLFHEALDLPSESRPAYLAALSTGDAPHRGAVEALLAANDSDDAFLETPAARLRPPSEDDVSPPSRIGPWSVVKEIGRGGMGAVYLVSRADAAYDQSAALKLVRADTLTRDARRRFVTERQILARLSHPNIAHLLDGGTAPDGRPYLVLEYVDGVPLTAYAEEKDLSVEKRLRLFLEVAAAIAYAHRNLVVHSDIKPSNILVTADGSPKLLDFGIAKLLHADLAGDVTATIAALRVLTPEYASPEQVRGEPVSTLSDVYSLGVVLFELLTGRRPLRVTSGSLSEIERVVGGEEPPLPSSVKPGLSRDLDAIVLMAIRKEPERRYASVERLAEDVAHYLDGRPVLARTPTASYRFRRFVRRHKALGAAVALVVLSLVGGTVASVRQARIADRERDKAEQVRAFLGNMLSTADPERGVDRHLTVAEVLDRASSRLAADLAGQPEVEINLRETLGNTYRLLGLPAESEREFRRALALASDSGEMRVNLAWALFDQGRFAETVTEAERVIGACRGQDRPPVQCVDALNLKMVGLQNVGKTEEAIGAGRQALALLERSFSVDAARSTDILNNLGVCYGNQGNPQEAETFHRRAMTASLAAHGERHCATADIAVCLAGDLDMQGRYPDAEILYRRALDLQEAVRGERHPRFILTLTSYANLLWLMKRAPEAEPVARRAEALARDVLGPERRETAYAESVLGLVLLDAGKATEAEEHIRIALADRRRSLPAGHWLIASAQSNLGAALLAQRRFLEAERELAEAYTTLSADRGPTHEKSRLTASRIADLYAATGRHGEALRYRGLSSSPTPSAP